MNRILNILLIILVMQANSFAQSWSNINISLGSPFLKEMVSFFISTPTEKTENSISVKNNAPLKNSYATSITLNILQNGDDSEENISTGAVDRWSSDLELTNDNPNSKNQIIGLRYENVSIPQGHTIDNAYIEFECDEPTSEATSITFWMEDIDDASNLTSNNYDISSRTKTSNSVAWSNIPAWNTAGQIHSSPELKDIIQEVVDRSGWNAGNDITVIIEGSGSRVAESYGSDGLGAPILHITYSDPPPTETCYAIGQGNNGQLYTWTPAGGQALIGTVGVLELETMTLDGACNTIHAIDGNVYGTVNASTGNFTGSYTLTSMEANGVIENINDVDGLAIDDNTGYLWAIERKVPGNDLLFQINPETGKVVEDIFGVGIDYVELAGAQVDVDDIAFNPCTGVLYGVSTISSNTTVDQIVTINTSTGALSVVATLANCDIEGLTFNNSCDLFASTGYEDCVTPNSIFSIDIVNQTSTLVTTFSTSDVEAVVCCVTAPVPTCDNFTNAGSIGYNETICIGDDVFEIQNASFPTGGVGATEVVWMYSTSTTTPPSGTSDSNWNIITGADELTYDPGVINVNTSYARLVKRDNCTNYLVSNVVTMTVQSCGTCTTISSQVNASYDDAEEDLATGNVDVWSSDLELSEDISNGINQLIGMRFTNLTIPQGANIASAYIEFDTDEISSTVTNLTFWSEDTDDAPTFDYDAYHLSNRTKTSASKGWNNIPAWTSTNDDHNSPNLNALVQEVVDRSGWSSGNDLVIFVEGTGSRIAESWNGENISAPKIHVTYCASAASDLTGRVFEDINYGGGDGRSYSESNTSAQSSGWSNDEIGVANAIVEIYDNAGNYISNTTTDANGNYTFTALVDGNYQVRVVNGSFDSNRGSNSTGETIIPVQTFRSTNTQNYINEIGGADPSLSDASANTASATLSSLTTGSNTAQSITSISIAGSNVSGVDFGYNFNTIVNTNDSGQGSVRQFILNSNELENDNLNQEDAPTNGVSFPKDLESETSIFMIPGSGVHTINPSSGLDAIEDSQTHLTGYTQQGSSQGPINSRTITIELEGNTVLYDGVTIYSSDVQLSGLSIHSFRKGIRSYKNNTTDNFIWGNYIGAESDGLTIGTNSSAGIELNNVNDSYIGTNADNVNDANEGNLAVDSYGGIEIKSTSNVLVAGNFVGTDKNGTGDLGNRYIGIHIINADGPNVIGFDDTATSTNADYMRNVSSGNGTDGIRISGGDNQVVSGNYLGTDVSGTLSIANGGYGFQLISNVNNLILGTDSDGDDDTKERNIISGNNAGIRFVGYGVGDGNRISGNFVGTDVTGNTALQNANNGIDISGDWTNVVIGTNSDGVNDGVEGNVISGNNEDGIRIADADGLHVAGNNIGVGYNNTSNVGNGKRGILIAGDASNNIIGYSSTLTNQDELVVGNYIKYNDDAGIGLSGNGTQNRISRNQSDSNDALGIDLDYDLVTANDNGDTDSGPNDLLNFPVLEGATIIGSDLVITGYAPANSEIEFFITDGGTNPDPRPSYYTKDFGEGAEYLFTAYEGGASDSDASVGTYTDDGTGTTTTKTQNKFKISVPASGLNLIEGVQITSTATNSNNSTSEFSGWTVFNTCDPNLGCELVGDPTNVSCHKGHNGAFTVQGIGGTPPYEYSLDGGSWSTLNTWTGLTNGTYHVSVRDANSCETTDCTIVDITEPAYYLGCELVGQLNHVSCGGSSDGSFTITGTEGTPPYSYSLNGGVFSTNNTFTNLTAGTYDVTVKDANDCTVVCQSINVTERITVCYPGEIEETTIACPSNDPGLIANAESPYTICNMIVNPEFDDNDNLWDLFVEGSNTASFSIDNTSQLSGANSAYVDITSATGTYWHIQLYQNPLNLVNGTQYELSFEAKASAARTVRVVLELGEAPWTEYWSQTINLTTTADTFSFSGIDPGITNNNISLYIKAGESSENFWVDNFVFGVKEAASNLNYQWQSRESDGVGGWSSWSDISGATSATYDPPVQANHFQYRRLANSQECSNFEPSNAIQVDACPCDVTMGANVSICTGDSIQISATSTGAGIVNYSWSPTTGLSDPNIANPMASPTTTTTYTVSIQDEVGCVETGDVVVTVFAPPTETLTLDQVIACTNAGTITLSGGTPANGEYSGPGVTNGIFDPIAAGTGTHTIGYTYTDTNGCIGIAYDDIEVFDPPAVSINLTDALDCISSTSLILSGGSPAGGTYTGNAVSGTIFNPSQAGVGVHPVTYTYTNNNGCINTATQNIIVNDLPEITIDDQTICQGDTISLVPTVCEPYVDIEAQRPLLVSGWSNVFGVGGTGISGDGELCFTLDDANLTSANMIGLNTDPHSSNNYTNIDFAIYVLVRHEHANPYLMQIREDGVSQSNPYNSTTSYVGSTFCIKRTGTTIQYLLDGVVKYTSAKSSTGTLYYDHSIHSAGGIYTGGYSKFTDISLCGEVDYDYSWSTGATSDTIEVYEANTYTAHITDSNGCIETAQAIITLNNITNPSATVEGPITCENTSVQLTALPADLIYTWNGPNNYVSSSRTPIVNVPGTYDLTIYDFNIGCYEYLSVEVLMESQGAITAVNVGCQDEDISVDYTIDGSESQAWIGLYEVGGANANFLEWSWVPTIPGSGTVTFSDHSLFGGTYEVRLYSTGGYILCESEQFTLDSTPDVVLSTDGGLTCEDSDVQLTATPIDLIYLWNGPNSYVSSSRTPTVSNPGMYVVTVTDPSSSCTTIDSIEVILESAGSIDQIQSSCNYDVITVDYTIAGSESQAWIGIYTPSAANNNFLVWSWVPTIPGSDKVEFTNHDLPPGDYEARLFSTAGYILCETESFTFGQEPECIINGRTLVEENTQNEIYTAVPNMTYAWTVISGDANIDGTTNGQNVNLDFGTTNSTLQVTITSSQGCSSVCTIEIEMSPAGQCNFRDEFILQAFDNSDGTEDWSNISWTEIGDDGDPIGGDIVFVSQKLRLDNDDSSLPAIERDLDLSTIANAVLSFNYNQGSGELESDDVVEVQIFDGSSWHVVLSDSGTIPPNSSPTIDISMYADVGSKIKIAITSGYADLAEYVFFDNVMITGDCIVPEICDDGIDNDFDGLTDCEDPDCGTYVTCVCQTLITNKHIYFKTRTTP